MGNGQLTIGNEQWAKNQDTRTKRQKRAKRQWE
jgi:hypothetical protein